MAVPVRYIKDFFLKNLNKLTIGDIRYVVLHNPYSLEAIEVMIEIVDVGNNVAWCRSISAIRVTKNGYVRINENEGTNNGNVVPFHKKFLTIKPTYPCN